ncbi:hypothetical protein RQP50_08460 [Paenibacillus sp. chi10]|uniref:MFS transporter n=1 Tax=Paenibacillus suaedae TaxID=3077233 RepID=A0AAJ2N408_9BACL|nr:hypothetical protein [Paenibacillus sp. chi10]MDT8976276.1 hypothetical protein [Paenibacillus sp. chi10]
MAFHVLRVVPIGIVGLVTGILILKDDKSSEKTKTDWLGVLTYGTGLTALLIALSVAQTWGWISEKTFGLFAVALFLWIIFIFIEKKVKHPLFHLGLFAYREYSIGLGITMSYCIGYFAVTILLTLYMQAALHLSPLESGLLLIPLKA